jgi:hypothetical protein
VRRVLREKHHRRVLIDIDRERDYARLWRIRAVPTTVILEVDKRGASVKVHNRVEGRVDADYLLEILRR